VVWKIKNPRESGFFSEWSVKLGRKSRVGCKIKLKIKGGQTTKSEIQCCKKKRTNPRGPGKLKTKYKR